MMWCVCFIIYNTIVILCLIVPDIHTKQNRVIYRRYPILYKIFIRPFYDKSYLSRIQEPNNPFPNNRKCAIIYITVVADKKHPLYNKHYVGAHFGYLNDGYVGSGVSIKELQRQNVSLRRKVLEYVSLDRNRRFISERETFWIKQLNSKECGLNRTIGGDYCKSW